MEDFSKFGVSPVSTDSVLRQNCFKCLVGTVDFLVPYGTLESFVLMCIRSGHVIEVYPSKEDVII